MSKFVKIIFLIAAMCIVADDYFQWVLKNSDTVMVDTKNQSDASGEDNENEEDKKEEKKETEEKDEKYSNEENLSIRYDFSLKSTLFSIQFALFQSDLNYKNRSRELESPPPEV
jgi:hypothetical protein